MELPLCKESFMGNHLDLICVRGHSPDIYKYTVTIQFLNSYSIA